MITAAFIDVIWLRMMDTPLFLRGWMLKHICSYVECAPRPTCTAFLVCVLVLFYRVALHPGRSASLSRLSANTPLVHVDPEPSRFDPLGVSRLTSIHTCNDINLFVLPFCPDLQKWNLQSITSNQRHTCLTTPIEQVTWDLQSESSPWTTEH
jgi:hypothetical protein